MASPLYNSRQLLLVVGILAAAGFGVALSIMQGPTSLRALLPPVQTSRPAGIIMSSADFTTVLTGTSTTIYIAGVDRDRPSSQRRINGVLQTEDIVADTALPSGATLTRCNYTGSSGTTPITVSVYCLQWTPSVTHLGSYPLVFRAREYGTGTWSDTPSALTLTVSNGSPSSSSTSSSIVTPFVTITSPQPNTTIGPVGVHTRIPISISYVTNQNADQKTVIGIGNAVSGTPLNQQTGTVTFANIGSGTHIVQAYMIIRATGQTIAGTLVQFPLTISVEEVSSGSSSSQSSIVVPSCGNGIVETNLGEQCDPGLRTHMFGAPSVGGAMYDHYGCFSTCLLMYPPGAQP